MSEPLSDVKLYGIMARDDAMSDGLVEPDVHTAEDRHLLLQEVWRLRELIDQLRGVELPGTIEHGPPLSDPPTDETLQAVTTWFAEGVRDLVSITPGVLQRGPQPTTLEEWVGQAVGAATTISYGPDVTEPFDSDSARAIVDWAVEGIRNLEGQRQR